ncbi:hypothetical protein [Enterococcus sp. DIV0187]|uniref:hypothetical protein n=1 Tax=Enterococcus sp. DIV0187 TaxID=2774644 RepID=UPI003F1F204F
MDKYKEFHRLKKDIVLKLLTIQDGDCMSDMPDDMLAVGTNKDAFDDCFAMMKDAKKLAAELAKHEELE